MELGFLKIDDFQGASAVPGFEGQIELTSFQYGCNQPTAPVQSYEPIRPGRTMHYMVKFTKHPDSSSRDFCQALWLGKTLEKAELTACVLSDGQVRPFLKITVEDVVIAEYNLINSEGATKEVISMNFSRITAGFIDKDGRESAASHNLQSNEVCLLHR